jgi:hypothetical protein
MLVDEIGRELAEVSAEICHNFVIFSKTPCR